MRFSRRLVQKNRAVKPLFRACRGMVLKQESGMPQKVDFR